MGITGVMKKSVRGYLSDAGERKGEVTLEAETPVEKRFTCCAYYYVILEGAHEGLNFLPSRPETFEAD